MNDLQNKNREELIENFNDLKTKLAKLSFELEANTLKDTSQIKKIKKEIAQILTTLNKM